MKVYITKYALTRGILERESCDFDHNYCVVTSDENGWRVYYYGKDWHKSLEEAKKDAESRRDCKIASLKKQLANLEEMKF